MRVVSHRHRATAAIDDRRIKNPAVFNAQGITLRRPNLQSGGPVADVVELVLIDAVSTDRGGISAARRSKIPAWSRRMGYLPIAGAVPGLIPDRDGRIQHLDLTLGLTICIFIAHDHVLINRQ